MPLVNVSIKPNRTRVPDSVFDLAGDLGIEPSLDDLESSGLTVTPIPSMGRAENYSPSGANYLAVLVLDFNVADRMALAGVAGLEPAVEESKSSALTTWLHPYKNKASKHLNDY